MDSGEFSAFGDGVSPTTVAVQKRKTNNGRLFSRGRADWRRRGKLLTFVGLSNRLVAFFSARSPARRVPT
jgi:hypothetical protein